MTELRSSRLLCRVVLLARQISCEIGHFIDHNGLREPCIYWKIAKNYWIPDRICRYLAWKTGRLKSICLVYNVKMRSSVNTNDVYVRPEVEPAVLMAYRNSKAHRTVVINPLKRLATIDWKHRLVYGFQASAGYTAWLQMDARCFEVSLRVEQFCKTCAEGRLFLHISGCRTSVAEHAMFPSIWWCLLGVIGFFGGWSDSWHYPHINLLPPRRRVRVKRVINRHCAYQNGNRAYIDGCLNFKFGYSYGLDCNVAESKEFLDEKWGIWTLPMLRRIEFSCRRTITERWGIGTKIQDKEDVHAYQWREFESNQMADKILARWRNVWQNPFL